MREIRDDNGHVVGYEPQLPLEPLGDPIEGEIFTELTEVREIHCTPLSVVVDFGELLRDHGETEAYEIVAKLKDLLT